jgi:septal ring factor EnvC (AmiA/AmiB activator)
MTDARAGGDELFLTTVIRNPIGAIDSALRTGAATMPALVDALRAIPRLAAAMERLTPALEATQGSLDRIDRLATFVAQELPETQHQLEELRKQMGSTASRIAELGPQLAAVTGVNRALNESIRLLTRGLGVVQGSTDVLGTILGRPRKEPEAR